MSNNMKVLIGILIIISGFAYWVSQNKNHGDGAGQQFLIPAWQENQVISDIDEVILSKAGETIKLKKIADNWVLNDGFYVSIDPLSSLLNSLKNAEIIEAKTANPENHAQVELAETDLLVKLSIAGELQQALHIGKQTTSGLTFIRNNGENQTYTVEGLSPINFSQENWSLKTVLDIAADEIVSVTLQPNAGDNLTINRDLETGQWLLNDLPDGFTQKIDANLNQIAGGLSRLLIDEAMPKNVQDENLKLTAEYQLLGGEIISVKVYQQDDKYMMTIESDQFSQYEGWMMQVADYKFDALNRTLSEYIEPVVNVTEANPSDTEPKE